MKEDPQPYFAHPFSKAIDSTEDPEALLPKLVYECLDRFETEGESAIEDVCKRHPEMAIDIRKRINSLDQLGLLSTSATQEEAIPERLGNFRLLRKIGTGGMGVVFEAEQDSPRRTVALKVIRSGFLSRQAYRRFAYETHFLGLLHHPGIAQIYEAGTAETETGALPYFAMELVRGRPLDQYANEQELNTRERLEILAKICESVQHAHQKGVMHRDLKPGNILVNEAGEPKILDFGLARATDPELDLTTLQTDAGQILGTVPYMSPEQTLANSKLLDTRSDIYSLGVIVYEVLAGELPYPVQDASTLAALQMIRETEPKSLGSAHRELRGDIETIVATALEKDKERRYQSASDLAADIHRFLRDEPITARPPSTAYQVKKFVRRHRALVSATLGAFVILLAGVTVSTIALFKVLAAKKQAQVSQLAEQEQRVAATNAKEEAIRQAALKESINRILKMMLGATDPYLRDSLNPIARDTKVVEVLERAETYLRDVHNTEPEVEAEVRALLGATYCNMGSLHKADTHLHRSLAIHDELYGDEDIRTLSVKERVGLLYYSQDKFVEAEQLFEECIQWRRQNHLAEESATLESINNLALVKQALRKLDEAESLYRKALQQRLESGLSESESHIAMFYHNLGSLLRERAEYGEAEEMLLKALEIREKTLSKNHFRTLRTLNQVAVLYDDLGRLDESRAYHEKIVQATAEALGELHHNTHLAKSNLAMTYLNLQLLPEAEELARDILSCPKDKLEDSHPTRIRVQILLGNALMMQRRLEEAEDIIRGAIATARERLGPKNQLAIQGQGTLGAILEKMGRLTEAEEQLSLTVEAYRDMFGEDHPRSHAPRYLLGRIRRALGRTEEALAVFEQLLQSSQNHFGPGHWATGNYHYQAALCLEELDNPEDAELELLEAFDVFEDNLGLDHAYTILIVQELVRFYETMEMEEDAEEFRQILSAH